MSMVPSLLVSMRSIKSYTCQNWIVLVIQGMMPGKFETYLCFLLGDINLDFSESTEELVSIDLLVSVKAVEVSEDSSQASDGLSSSCVDLGSHLLEN